MIRLSAQQKKRPLIVLFTLAYLSLLPALSSQGNGFGDTWPTSSQSNRSHSAAELPLVHGLTFPFLLSSTHGSKELRQRFSPLSVLPAFTYSHLLVWNGAGTIRRIGLESMSRRRQVSWPLLC